MVEIKADDAHDSVFGQILRYIGWVHLNLPDGSNNVRGIILAGGFPETAASRVSECFALITRHSCASRSTA